MATRSGDMAAPAGPARLLGQFWVYTVLRIALFGAVIGVLWLVNVRGMLGLLIAVLLSVPLSFVLLARPRAALAASLAQRVEARQKREGLLRQRLAGETDAADHGADSQRTTADPAAEDIDRPEDRA